MSNALLITNNTTRGRINAYDPKTGAYLGALRDTPARQSRSTTFGRFSSAKAKAGSNGNTNQLFFTAGNNNYGSGTFGVITLGN